MGSECSRQQDNASQPTPFIALCRPAEAMRYTCYIRHNINMWLLDGQYTEDHKIKLTVIHKAAWLTNILQFRIRPSVCRCTPKYLCDRSDSDSKKLPLSVGTVQTSGYVINWEGACGSLHQGHAPPEKYKHYVLTLYRGMFVACLFRFTSDQVQVLCASSSLISVKRCHSFLVSNFNFNAKTMTTQQS